MRDDVVRCRHTAAVIVCAGKGMRLGGKDKAFLTLAGRPLIIHALERFRSIAQVSQLIFVVRRGCLDKARRCLAKAGCFSATGKKKPEVFVVAGGKRRQDSVYNGLRALDGNTRYVLIHDVARPLVSARTINVLLSVLKRHRAAICAVAVSDTIKSTHGGRVVKTLPRDGVVQAQTPQGFRKDVLLDAYRRFRRRPAFDDAQMVERAGCAVRVVEGDGHNIKITYPGDLRLAEALTKT